MNITEELYIIVENQKIRLDIETPSGITLKYISNMFNDLTKFCASYSYTFKIPKTKNNMLAFDLIDDVRHDSNVYGKRIQCLYVRDGFEIFKNSFLYVNDTADDCYNAVMTWNVIEWLLQVKEDGLTLQDLEKNASELTTILWGSTPSENDNQNMSQKRVNGAYRCGWGDEFGNNPPLVPVRYLLDRIAKYYGKEDARSVFSFMRLFPVSTEDMQTKMGANFKIWEDGAIPLTNGEWSEKYDQTQRKIFNLFHVVNYENSERAAVKIKTDDIAVVNLPNQKIVSFSYPEGVDTYFDTFEHVGYVKKVNEVWTHTEEHPKNMIAFFPKRSGNSIYAACKLRFYANVVGSTSMSFQIVPIHLKYDSSFSGSLHNYEPYLDDDGNILYSVDLTAEYDDANRLYVLNYDPEKGGKEIEMEIDEDAADMAFWMIIANNGLDYVPEGKMQICVDRQNSELSYAIDGIKTVDLFHNLPKIKIMDFIKSLFYIENGYPVLEADGKIGIMDYQTLYDNITNNKFYDWSQKVIYTKGKTKVAFTNGNVAQKNLFVMSNYSEDMDEDQKASKYDPAFAYFKTENETLSKSATIFQFPYASACVKNELGALVGRTFPYWEKSDKVNQRIGMMAISYQPKNPDPIIGRINVEGQWNDYSWSQQEAPKYLQYFHIWQVADKNYEHTILAKILKKPYVITEVLNLDIHTLSNLNFGRPVYLDKYNAFFAIITLQIGNDGLTKAELIKLPPLYEMSNQINQNEPTIELTGASVLYKTGSGSVGAMYEVVTHVQDSYIQKVRITVDDLLIKEGRANHLRFFYSGDSGTHTIKVVSTAANGKTATALMPITIRYASEQQVIELSGSITKDAQRIKNIPVVGTQTTNGEGTFSAKAFNYDGLVSLSLTWQKLGSTNATTFATATSDQVSGTFVAAPAEEEGNTKYVIKAVLVDANGTKEVSKEVSVYTQVIDVSQYS